MDSLKHKIIDGNNVVHRDPAFDISFLEGYYKKERQPILQTQGISRIHHVKKRIQNNKASSKAQTDQIEGNNHLHSSTRFLAFSDIHGNVEVVHKMLQEVRGLHFDGVLIAGDITNGLLSGNLAKANEDYQRIMDLLSSLNIPIYYVLGNRDYVPTKTGLQSININLPHFLKDDEKIKISSDLFLTSNEKLVDAKTILLTHGIEEPSIKPLLQIAGHTHCGVWYGNYLNLGFLYRDEAHGASKALGCFWEINIDETGSVDAKWHNLGGMQEVKCTKHEFATFYTPSNWKSCPMCFNKISSEWKIFKEDLPEFFYRGSELISIPLVGFRRAQIFEELGISQVTELARIDPQGFAECPEIRNARDKAFATRVSLIVNYAKAISSGDTIITGAPPPILTQNHENAYFFDLEYDPEGHKEKNSIGVCLIGLMDMNGIVTQFFAENSEEEEKMLCDFDAWLFEKKPLLFTYSSRSADEPMLLNAYKKFGIKGEGLKQTEFLDLFYDIICTQVAEKQKIYLPISDSLGAKEVSDYFGYKEPKSLQIHDGLQGLIAFRQYLTHGKKEVKQQLLLYNKCDLERTALIFDRLKHFFSSPFDVLGVHEDT